MMKVFLKASGMLVMLILIMQLVPINQENPPIHSDITAPEPVLQILKKACFDCHSNHTHWPWYSKIAPVSWLVVYDVAQGRAALNYSTWNSYSRRKQSRLLRETAEEIEHENMPLWYYLPLHRDAALKDEERASLTKWAQSESTRILSELESRKPE